ncbi:Panacea domain-containing protein [Halorussus caseinilyticus]|uniref:Panacea domain-containing protein n=1 Tax=Halorussus caseinilyticus TaxID=3034025 RepID=A0ABD5WFU8_9EURY|nr:Panacea domain-containing protein [Halorussus sp. DT72]
MPDSESVERTDTRELKEIIKEFLNHLDFAYNYRLQKLVYYGEIWCLQTYGRRLTDATFKAHHYGSFSDDIADALEEMRNDEEVEYETVVKPDGPTYEYSHHEDGGELSPGKKEIIEHIHNETNTMSTEDLAKFSKQTWLYQNTDEAESMDFEYYRDEVVIPQSERERVAERDGCRAESDADLREALAK